MATLATILRKVGQAGSLPRQVGELPHGYRLRALPNEDIFFYRKRVDNSRLVREPDPRAKTECWSAIGAVCALAAVLITSFVPSVAGITAGYQIEALKQERQRLLNERRSLEVELARQVGPERLEQLAKDQNMGSPKPDQVVNLHTDASAGTVAFNVGAKKRK